MDFNFDTAARLAREDPVAFELYRHDLIADFIEAQPPEKQAKLAALQAELDLLREQLSPPDFSRLLLVRINDNLESLNDQFVALRHRVSASKQP